MRKLDTQSNKASLQASEEVKQICSPLQDVGINFFNFVRCYNDGSITALTTHSKWHNHFLEMSEVGRFKLKSLDSGVYLWSDHMPFEVLNDAKEDFKLRSFLQFQNVTDEYCDFYAYGADAENHEMVSYYFNNLDLLEKFNTYFTEKSAPLFKRIDKVRDFSSDAVQTDRKTILEKNDPLANVIEDHLAEQRSLHGLTKRELDCLSMLADGCSPTVIAAELFISRRTVEKHLENARQRLECHDIYQLIKIYNELF